MGGGLYLGELYSGFYGMFDVFAQFYIVIAPSRRLLSKRQNVKLYIFTYLSIDKLAPKNKIVSISNMVTIN